MRNPTALLLCLALGAAGAAQDPAEMKAKGMVDVGGGVFVQKEHVADAKRGVFHFGDELVTKDEYKALSEGQVRHPITGALIKAEDLDKASARNFPIGTEGRMVGEDEADEFHREPNRPWILTTPRYVFVSSLPIAKIESLREHADRAMDRLRPVLGFAEPKPADRPTVVIAATQDHFVDLGAKIGDETSAYGGFLAREGALTSLPMQGETRPAVCLWDEGWGPYYLPHAVGLAYANSICLATGAELPAWMLHGLAALGSRFANKDTGVWFAQGLAKTGGVRNLEAWIKAYKLDGGMDPDEISANLTQAGLLFDFCMQSGDAEGSAALQALTEAFQKGKAAGIEKAQKALAATLKKRQSQVEAYFQKLVR